MNKRFPVAAAQQVLDLLLDRGHSVCEVHRQTGIALQSLNNIKLGRYPKVSEDNLSRLALLLGYYPDDVREAEVITVRPEYVAGFLLSEAGRGFVDKCRDGVIAA